jgi:nucleoside-diphosphate-sugar epimerase
MIKKKVLLVGGAGYIGGLTCDYLIKDGFEVTVYDNLLYENRYLKEIPFIYGDIRDTEKLYNASKDFDVIVLMAALVGDPACSVDPFLTEEINYKAIKNFCEVVSPNKHLIFMSTCSVYGAQDGLLNEESKTNPLSSYATTKLKSEEHVLAKGGTIFRLGTVFGLGDTYSRLRMDLVVNVLTMKAVKDGEITINGGEQWRPIIAVKDIAGYVTEACKEKHQGIYVLAKENVIIRELGERVAKLIPNTKVNYTEISFQDARNYRVDNQKSLNTFSYKPIVSVEDEVARMIALFEENRIENPEDKLYHNGAFLTNKKNQNELLWTQKN